MRLGLSGLLATGQLRLDSLDRAGWGHTTSTLSDQSDGG